MCLPKERNIDTLAIEKRSLEECKVDMPTIDDAIEKIKP